MWSFGTTMTMADDKKPGKEAATKHENLPPPPQPTPSEQIATAPPRQKAPFFSQRSANQLGLFLAGASFLTLSTLITRRAVSRKLRITVPKFYQQSNRPVSKIDSDGSLIAVEALGLASLNVMGFGIMMTGGLAWAFDISSVDDLRSMARRHTGQGGRTDAEAEREVEEWVAKWLLKREDVKASDKDKPSDADKPQ